MIIRPDEVTILRSQCVNREGGFILTECVESLSAHFHVERSCPPGYPAYLVVCKIQDKQHSGMVFLAPGQTLTEACPIHFAQLIDITKAKIILGKYVWQ